MKKKYVSLAAACCLSLVLMTGCGSNDQNATESPAPYESETPAATSAPAAEDNIPNENRTDTTASPDNVDDGTIDNTEDTDDGILDNDPDNAADDDNVLDKAGNAARSAVDGVGDGVKDAVDGVENAVGDMTR